MPDPRYRPSPLSRPRPPSASPSGPSPRQLAEWRRTHLAAHPGCQWVSKLVRCPVRATDVVWSRQGVLRSTCETPLAAWLRTGGRRLADPPVVDPAGWVR